MRWWWSLAYFIRRYKYKLCVSNYFELQKSVSIKTTKSISISIVIIFSLLKGIKQLIWISEEKKNAFDIFILFWSLIMFVNH